MNDRVLLRRRDALIGFGGMLAARPTVAWACHEERHPCQAVAVVPKSGPQEAAGAQIEGGIRAMQDYLRSTDPSHRGPLDVVILDSAGDTAVAIERVTSVLERARPSAVIATDFSVPSQEMERLGARFATPFVTIVSGSEGKKSEWVCKLAPTPVQVASGLLGYLRSTKLPSGQHVSIAATGGRQERADTFAAILAAAGFTVDQRVALPDDPSAAAAALTETLAAAPASVWVLSVPVALDGPVIGSIQRAFDAILRAGGRVVLDVWLGDPARILRAASKRGIVALSSFAPDLLSRRPIGREMAPRLRQRLDGPPTALASVAATATQVVAAAMVLADENSDDYGRVARDALRELKLPAEDLIVVWNGVSFDRETFENQGARVAALELRDNDVVTVWPNG